MTIKKEICEKIGSLTEGLTIIKYKQESLCRKAFEYDFKFKVKL